MRLDPIQLFSRIDLSSREALVVAVSGGGDSLALLHLLKEYLDRSAPHVRIVAATVDHGLRAGAAGEAALVGDVCRSLGVEHRILQWSGEKPESGVQAAAREARYDLLAQAADAAGTDIVLLGHTLEDQAETVAMRAERQGSGPGLAGMASETLFDTRIWLLRPLLSVGRRTLRDYLDGLAVRWVEDPTNEDWRYERVRVRAALSRQGDEAVATLARRAALAAGERADLGARAAALIGRFVGRPSAGLYRLDPEMFLDLADRPAATHAFRILLAVAGGTPHLPERERASGLADRAAGEPFRATLSRAVVDARRNGVWIRRETRGLPESSELHGRGIWDGRYRIVAHATDRQLRIAALGAGSAWELGSGVPPEVPESLVRAALALEPALFGEDGLIALADSPKAEAAGVSAEPVAAPFARFLPGFDLAAAQTLQRLIGAPPLPAAPWNKHIALQA